MYANKSRWPSAAQIFIFALIVEFAIAGGGQADDWPQWLGPRRDSVWRETGILERFPEGGPKVKWRTEVAGGFAGPAVADGRVFVPDYVTTGDKTPDYNKRSKLEGTERVLCFAAADGRQLWKHEYPCPYEISYPAGPRVTPTVDDKRLYALGAEGNLFCLSVEDGAVIWSKDFKKDFGAKTAFWGYSGHPLVEGEKLICVVGGEGSVAVAFDKRTGKELWRALSAKEQGYSAPTIIETAGKRQLLIWHAEAINSLDPETGRLYWSVPLDPNWGMAIATPRQLGNHLFVGGIINKAVLLKLGDEKPSAEVVWQANKRRGIDPVNSPPFLEDGFMYGVDRYGELRCVRLSDGEHVWSTNEPTTGGRRANSATSFLVKHGDRFFVTNEMGDLIIARLSPDGYDEISRWHMLDPTGVAFGRDVVWSHPAFANRCVFARNDKELVCVSLAAD